MGDLPDLGSDVIGVAIRSAVVYLFLVVGLRFGGKREVGQLTLPDLVVLLVIANGVQNAMVGSNTTLIGGLVSGAVVLVIARLIQVAVERSPRLEQALIGEPRVIVRDGQPLANALREEEITPSELAAALREHGIEEVTDVRLAVLEVDGSISVIPRTPDDMAPGEASRTAGRLPRRRLGRRGRSRPSEAADGPPA
ncbi:MAG TPA: YetF domain-containing protein [Candidatus Limnocylindrales bacterium]